MRWVPALMLLVAIGLSGPRDAAAQYIYLDSNADSINTSDDRLSGIGSTLVDIWLVMDRHRDGSAVTCAAGESLTGRLHDLTRRGR